MFVAHASPDCIRSIMTRTDIGFNHKILMVAIAMNHNYQHNCEVGIEQLRRDAGMSLRTAYRSLARMEELGFVSKTKDGLRSCYRNTTCGWGEIQ